MCCSTEHRAPGTNRLTITLEAAESPGYLSLLLKVHNISWTSTIWSLASGYFKNSAKKKISNLNHDLLVLPAESNHSDVWSCFVAKGKLNSTYSSLTIYSQIF